jgi:hypothetical protein
MKKLKKSQGRLDRLQLLATILARWQRLVASNKALSLFYWAMRMVLYRCTTVALFVCCCPGGRWGNTEQVVAQWQRPVASGVALDMPHRAMPSVSLRRTAVAIETASR